MEKFIFKTKSQMGAAAAASAAQVIKQAIKVKKQANMILATGTSQFEMLKNLAAADEIDWQEVTMFHLDEYIGLSADHPASFRRFLKERFVDKVPGLKAVHFVNGDAKDPQQECRRISAIIAKHPIDVALLGIGENGHLAFNDPPADFATLQPYIVVELDEKCRRQQLGEGWFRDDRTSAATGDLNEHPADHQKRVLDSFCARETQSRGGQERSGRACHARVSLLHFAAAR